MLCAEDLAGLRDTVLHASVTLRLDLRVGEIRLDARDRGVRGLDARVCADDLGLRSLDRGLRGRYLGPGRLGPRARGGERSVGAVRACTIVVDILRGGTTLS